METYIAVTLTDGTCAHVALQTDVRPDTDANIEFELARLERAIWSKDGNTVVSWRRISSEEHDMFSKDRPGIGSVYRNALVDNNGKIEYDMTRAKDCHRNQIRRERSSKLQQLDGEWMKATGQKDEVAADVVEAERQKWRDAPTNPRIDAAQTIEELKALEVISARIR